MKFKLVCHSTVAILWATSTHAVVIEIAAVGNAGNLPDIRTGLGAVPYEFGISKTEVTNAQYSEFLNAVDPSGANPLGLFDIRMDVTIFGGVSLVPGNSSGSKFVAKAGRENQPVNFVSWYDSVRFMNWLHNGQGGGDTETGAYSLGVLDQDGTPIDGSNITREANARFWLPSESEWYKVAYHNATAGTLGDYLNYATGRNIKPHSDQPGDDPAAANYFNDDGLANGFNDGYAVSGTTDFPTQSPLTSVGAYAEAVSAYGTYDQNGNLAEWTENLLPTPNRRGVIGGAYNSNLPDIPAGSGPSNPATGGDNLGFRVATVPEPNTAILVCLIAIGTVIHRRRNRQQYEA